MPLTITTAELAAAIRLTADASVAPAEPQLAILHRQLRVAESEVDGYAPEAPDDTKDEAAIRMIGYLYDAPNTALNNAPHANAFRFSGAMALLSRWHVPGSTPVSTSTPAVDLTIPTTPESGLTPSTHPVHPGTHFRYMGWSDGASVDAGELAAGGSFTTDVLTVPNRATAGYLWAAFDASVGVPNSALLDGNPTNQIGNWRQQGGTLNRGGVDYDILISTAELSAALAGRTWTFGYSSP